LAILPKNSLYVHRSRSQGDKGAHRRNRVAHVAPSFGCGLAKKPAHGTENCPPWSALGSSAATMLTIPPCDRKTSSSTTATSSASNRDPRLVGPTPSLPRATVHRARMRKSESVSDVLAGPRLEVRHARMAAVPVHHPAAALIGGSGAHGGTRKAP
jgi:hypothetical protein